MRMQIYPRKSFIDSKYLKRQMLENCIIQMGELELGCGNIIILQTGRSRRSDKCFSLFC